MLELAGIAKGGMGAWLFAFGAAGLAGNAMASRWTSRSAHPASLATACALLVIGAFIAFLPGGQVALFFAVCLWGAAHAASFVINQLQVTRAAPAAPRLAAAMNISAANVGIAAGSPVGRVGPFSRRTRRARARRHGAGGARAVHGLVLRAR